MHGTMVDVRTEDGVADAYLVRPAGAGPWPGVLFYMDAFGLRPRVFEMAGRIAARGYAVLAPNLLYRGGRAPLIDLSGLGDPEQRRGIIGKMMPLIRELDTAAITRDTRAYLDFLAEQGDVADGPVAVVGYCMGGTNAFRAIGAFPERIVALASFHGGQLATEEPDSPHLKVGRITGEVYFAHADHDHAMPQEQIDRLEAALDAADVRFRSEIYAGAAHGFTMSEAAAYDAPAESRHWEKLFELLDDTLPSQSSSSRPGK
ncbi:dienelactone hydrolase family protein [Amorphoplanes digitatis]|uniref:Carboxymethylenebutenolidase n=1 Tax=Actinoplanes digitatis TaxID=1868 RepID=A0A7W7I6T2_9ACTN|nr:dienelactone hydrolase family protein [Actinoplanes digitatis]MBB4767458.1 carboxymethylenebutenolidase [Actinoplanes digitatis]BFE67173.1 dienelactone hydrolase family protein [Actinoplanes digitatis]GID97884.1 hydrolase [Actinoplanes digitatis]